MTRVTNNVRPSPGMPPSRSQATRPAGGARGDAGGFGEQLTERYRVLATDDEALEAAKLVVQTLPWLSAPQEQLRLVSGGVVARGAAKPAKTAPTGRPGTSGTPNNLTLHLQINGAMVDITASAAHRETVELLLAARDELTRALRENGLTLRRLVAAEAEPADEPASNRFSSTDPALMRSYMEVIA